MSQILSAMTSKFLFIMRASGSSSERESKVRRICAIERVYQDIKFGQKTLEACNCDLRSKNAGQSRGKRNKTAPILCKCDITKQAQPSLQTIAENVSSSEFTFTFIVTFIVPVFVPGRHVRYKPTFSIFVPSWYKNWNNKCHHKCKSKFRRRHVF
jgi:hypothetical protein